MQITKENIERKVHSMLLEWGWERGWANAQKQAWTKQFNDIVKQKNPDAMKDPNYQTTLDFFHKQGIPAADAAEKMYLTKPQGPLPGELPISRSKNQYL